MNKKLSNRDLNRMEKLVKEGKKITDIAKKFGVSRKQVYFYINQRGWRKKKGILNKFMETFRK